MYRAHAEYHHRPYKKDISSSDIFFTCAKLYVVLFTVFHISVWLTERPVFQFKNITLTGTHAVLSSDVEQIVREPLEYRLYYAWKRNNAAFYPRARIEQRIKDLDRRLASVNVSVDRSQIAVAIKEYTPKIRYCLSPLSREKGNVLELPSALVPDATTSTSSLPEVEIAVLVPPPGGAEVGLKELPVSELIDAHSHDCFWADEAGYIFAVAPHYSGFPLLTIVEKDPAGSSVLMQEDAPMGTKIVGDESFGTLMRIVESLKVSGVVVRQITLLANDDINLDVGFPWTVSMSLKRDANDSVDHLLLALKELGESATGEGTKLKHIDVRFGNKVFYK
jgi:hypothetical protein